MVSIGSLIATSRLPAAEARLLVAFVLGVGRAHVAAHAEEDVDRDAAHAIEALFARRRAGEPIAYLTQEREFFGLSLRVGPAVLIPRPETELVVEQALAAIAGRASPRVLDLGTGSGAIAVAIAHARPDAEVWASDTSAAALDIARENAARHSVRVRFVGGEWFGALGGERFDLIAANPPYVAHGDPHLREGDLPFEPEAALLGGPDGMQCLRHIAITARAHLFPGGWLVVEHGHDQGECCRELLVENGYGDVEDLRDLAGLPRVCKGKFDAPQVSG